MRECAKNVQKKRKNATSKTADCGLIIKRILTVL